jgi:hypothetical protein
MSSRRRKVACTVRNNDQGLEQPHRLRPTPPQPRARRGRRALVAAAAGRCRFACGRCACVRAALSTARCKPAAAALLQLLLLLLLLERSPLWPRRAGALRQRSPGPTPHRGVPTLQALASADFPATFRLDVLDGAPFAVALRKARAARGSCGSESRSRVLRDAGHLPAQPARAQAPSPRAGRCCVRGCPRSARCGCGAAALLNINIACLCISTCGRCARGRAARSPPLTVPPRTGFLSTS